MIVLDTNVLSELVRPRPDRAVINWVDDQDSAELAITSLTAAEMRAGIALLPNGRRQQEISQLTESLLTETFAGYVFAFDADSATYYAEIMAARRKLGRPIGVFDAQIAAVCRQHESILATRNTSDFSETGIPLINPWDPAASKA